MLTLYIFGSILACLQVILPKKWGFVPLLIAACHFGNGEVLPELTICRLVIVVGLLRAAATGSLTWSKKCKPDIVILVFAVIAILVSMAPRQDVPSPLKQNLGLILNVVGSYIYARSYLQGEGLLERFAAALCYILIPLSIFMSVEQRTQKNLYAGLGAKNKEVAVRLDRVRASGPFRHPILAGTVGATSLPLMLILWRRRKKLAVTGMGVCLIITVASSSSGPLAALGAGVFALSLWPLRRFLVPIQVIGIIALIFAHLASTRGIWYLMASMDLVGGSTGYHRARLIDSAIGDFSRWWLAGTDYTRTWMFSGVSWSPLHTDITNYYLHLGVIGGMGLLSCLVILLFACVRELQHEFFFDISTNPADKREEVYWDRLAVWCLASAIFSHAVSFMSISYFDQMFAVFYSTIGLVGGVVAWGQSRVVEAEWR